MDRKEIVRQGYDKVSYAYRNERGDDEFSDYASWLAELTALVPSAAAILDLGCGCGVPVAQSLARDYAVTGVDISPVQIERARRTVPHATFVCADMSEVDFPARSFAAIVSFYAIIHLPLSEQPGLLARIHQWLEPHGYAMLIVGNESWTGVEEDWLGVLVVEHHPDLIFDVCDHVTVLNLGRTLAAGTPAEIRSHREVVNAYLGA